MKKTLKYLFFDNQLLDLDGILSVASMKWTFASIEIIKYHLLY